MSFANKRLTITTTCKEQRFSSTSGIILPNTFAPQCSKFIANEAADSRGSAVELANHRAVREYKRKISSQRKGLF